jgi:PAS domain S-box-containing protein
VNDGPAGIPSSADGAPGFVGRLGRAWRALWGEGPAQAAAPSGPSELLSALIDLGQDAGLISGTDGVLRYASSNLPRLFGYDRQSVLGRPLTELFYPPDQAKLLDQLSALKPGASVRVRVRLRRGDGRGLLWVQAVLEDRRHAPPINGVLIQLRDLTPIMEFEAAVLETEDSLRRSESFYRMVIEGSSDLVLLLDARHKVIFASQASKVLLGRRPDEMKGRDILDFVVEEDRFRALEALESTLRKAWVQVRVRVLHASGSRPLAQAHGRYSVDPDGRPIFIVAAHDITREDALERRTIEEGRLEAISRLAGGVAHDFNNLLTVIQGNTELALVDPGEATPGRLNDVLDASVRAGQLVQQLLALGRNQILTVRRIDLGSLLREHEGFIRRMLGADSRLELAIPEGPLVLRAEPLSLARSLLNLVANAKEAMPEGGSLSVRCARYQVEPAESAQHPERAPGAYLRLDIRDSGVGMEPEVLSRIFEPYFSTHGRGSGLGLAMVLGVVRQLDGFISVESQPRKGSCFSLFLPEVTDDEPAAQAPAAPAAPAHARPAGNSCVLVVDDEGAILRLAADGLRHQGYQVLEAGDGEEALALWAEARRNRHRIDLVLSDVVMPRMDGIQLLGTLQSADPSQRCLLMSGYYDMEKVLREGRSVGLSKPFTLQALYEAVEKALRGAPKVS